MEPGQGNGSQTFCAETKSIRGMFVFHVQLCIYAFTNLEKTVVNVSAVYLGFLLPQRSTTIFGSDENQKLETTNKYTQEYHADVNHYNEKSLCVKREIALQFLYIWECCG